MGRPVVIFLSSLFGSSDSVDGIVRALSHWNTCNITLWSLLWASFDGQSYFLLGTVLACLFHLPSVSQGSTNRNHLAEHGYILYDEYLWCQLVQSRAVSYDFVSTSLPILSYLKMYQVAFCYKNNPKLHIVEQQPFIWFTALRVGSSGQFNSLSGPTHVCGSSSSALSVPEGCMALSKLVYDGLIWYSLV